MQISPPSRILPMNSNDMYTYQKRYASFRHTQETFLVQNSNKNDTVTLSLSNTSIHLELMYSAEEIVEHSGTTSSGQEFNLVENPLYQYLELIRERVEFLLKELSPQISGKSQHKKSLPLNGNQSLVGYGYTTYSQSTIQVSQNMTIESVNSYFPDFSPESTAERIIQFALSFYDGGDRQEYAAMVRKAVMKGFNEARAALGVLPQVSYDTIALVNRALVDFAGGKEFPVSA